MTKRAPFHQSDVSRAVRGALKAGLPLGSFSVEIVAGTVRILPIATEAPKNDALEAERLMREAFGE